MNLIDVLPGLDAGTYQRHSLHGDAAIWPEKNCYVDLWIELLHTLGLDPLAMLPFTLAVDFEGDQWTFFKPSLEELRALYGIDVQELTVWRPLLEHAAEHLGAGKLISTEADAFWLPDTAGTDYRIKHGKTTIVLSRLDVNAQQLGYFHNAAYFELAGDDFAGFFRTGASPDPGYVPLFAELIRMDRQVRRSQAELAALSLELLRRHFERRPLDNPFHRFGARFQKDLSELQSNGLVHYHAWAFASVRQAGAAFELVAANLRWQAAMGQPDLTAAAECFEAISLANKALILKGARAASSGRVVDASALFSSMAQAWDQGMGLLAEALSPEFARAGRYG